MQINFYQNTFYNHRAINTPDFKGRGKPITLEYIVDKRSYLLPERILNASKKLLSNPLKANTSLLDLHKETYSPLLTCKTLDEAKKLFPEFETIIEEVTFKRPKSIYAKQFNERTEDDNFALKMLQELWAKLKTKDEIAKDFGMNNRSSLDWVLKQINFVSLNTNYRKLLLASDEAGNKAMAEKTQAWNSLHPDLMYAHNKKAAQGCKTPEYRAAQSIRIKNHDKKHPERIEKISKTLREGWEKCPEVREAMSIFARNESNYIKSVWEKKYNQQELTEYEKRTLSGFYKRFWAAHPELKAVYAEARKGCKG